MTIANRTESVTTSASATASPLPVRLDTRGRVRTSKEQRRLILEQFAASGQSAVAFAKRTGLKYSTLAGWLTRYRPGKPQRRVPPLRLLEAVVGTPLTTGTGPLVLQLPGGARAEIANASQAALAAILVRALIQPC